MLLQIGTELLIAPDIEVTVIELLNSAHMGVVAFVTQLTIGISSTVAFHSRSILFLDTHIIFSYFRPKGLITKVRPLPSRHLLRRQVTSHATRAVRAFQNEEKASSSIVNFERYFRECQD